MELFSDSLTILERSLDMRAENQRIIASNLANIDTPGYKARELDFAASLQKAIDQAEDPLVINESEATARGLDGNNVDLETELGKMSGNRVLYSVTAQVMAAKFRQMTTIFDKES
ncbi:MAG: flagellar basal body rod protein FlgB [bacterium]|nr:flagellar basal body rod protein FlgB [bacterium]